MITYYRYDTGIMAGQWSEYTDHWTITEIREGWAWKGSTRKWDLSVPRTFRVERSDFIEIAGNDIQIGDEILGWFYADGRFDDRTGRYSPVLSTGKEVRCTCDGSPRVIVALPSDQKFRVRRAGSAKLNDKHWNGECHKCGSRIWTGFNLVTHEKPCQ